MLLPIYYYPEDPFRLTTSPFLRGLALEAVLHYDILDASMTIESKPNEKRRARRVEATGPISFTQIKDSQPALLKNISKNGLCCISETHIPEMTQVALAIQMPALPEEDRDHYLLKCQGAVVRCDPVVRSNSRAKWEIGIFFTEMNSEAIALLEAYIASRS